MPLSIARRTRGASVTVVGRRRPSRGRPRTRTYQRSADAPREFPSTSTSGPDSDKPANRALNDYRTMAQAATPPWERCDPIIPEDPAASTESSELQQETAEECLPLLLGKQRLAEMGENGLPKLGRKKHAVFLRLFLGRLPPGFTILDASRPWMLYWCTMGLSSVEEDTSLLSQR